MAKPLTSPTTGEAEFPLAMIFLEVGPEEACFWPIENIPENLAPTNVDNEWPWRMPKVAPRCRGRMSVMRIAASDTRDISRWEVRENDLRYRSMQYRYCIARLLLSGTRSFEVPFGLVLQEVLGVVILQLLLARKK